MKKLMIAAAIVCAAVISQAATVKWTVSSMKLPGTNGAYADGAAGLAKITMSVYLITGDDAATTFAGLTADNIYSTYNGKTADFTGKTNMGGATLSASGYDTGDNVYAAILFTYNDGKNDWYVANKAQATIVESLSVAQDATIANLNVTYGGEGNAVNFGGDYGTTITGWTKVEAVPEPTSGLLLLLGVAGLALKRRRA